MDVYLPARLLPLPSLRLSDIPGCSVTPLGPTGGCDPAGCQTVVPRVVVGAASLMLSDVRRMKSAVRCVSSFPSAGRLQAVGCRAGVGPGLCQLRGLRTEMTRASLEAAGAQVCPGGMQTADAGGRRGICHSTVPLTGREEAGGDCVGSPGGARRVDTEGPLWSVGTVAHLSSVPHWAAPFGP